MNTIIAFTGLALCANDKYVLRIKLPTELFSTFNVTLPPIYIHIFKDLFNTRAWRGYL